MTPDAYTFARVTELRARTPPVPWNHVSRQVGFTEITLRRLCDPTFTTEAAPIIPAPVAKARRPRQKNRGPQWRPPLVKPGSTEAGCLVVMGSAAITARRLAFRANIDDRQARNAISALSRKGLIEKGPKELTWIVTAKGHAALAQLDETELPRAIVPRKAREPGAKGQAHLTLAFLHRAPSTGAEVAKALSMPTASIQRRIRDLLASELIEPVIPGVKPASWKLTEAGLSALAELEGK